MQADFDIHLIAKLWPVALCLAMYTLPKLPAPTTRPNKKSARLNTPRELLVERAGVGGVPGAGGEEHGEGR